VRQRTSKKLGGDQVCRRILGTRSCRGHVGIGGARVLRWGVFRRSPSNSRLRLLILGMQLPVPSLGSGRCVCMFCCPRDSLGRGGTNRLGTTGISWCLLCRVHAWKSIIEIAAVNHGGCCRWISSQLHQTARERECAVRGSISARFDGVPSIKCFLLCPTSSFPHKHILLLIRGGTVCLVPAVLAHPLLYGILRRGRICNLIAPSCKDS
jgi:hypothetical protein